MPVDSTLLIAVRRRQKDISMRIQKELGDAMLGQTGLRPSEIRSLMDEYTRAVRARTDEDAEYQHLNKILKESANG